MALKPILKPGDTIGVFSPSSALGSLDELDPAISLLQKRGYKINIHPQTGAKLNQSAGTNDEKAKAFHDLLLNDEIDLIWASRGGNRASQFLELIDCDLWKKSGKKVIGYSDTTNLHCAALTQCDIPCVQGPLFREIGTSLPDAQFEFLMAYLESGKLDYPLHEAEVISEGQVSGPLIGGTFFVLQNLIGTSYFPNTDGAILYLEDINEELSRIDRAFQHLKMALPFENLGGLMIGDFISPQDTGAPYGFSLDDIIFEHVKDFDFPVIKNIPFGHGDRLFALPFGQKATLSVSKEKSSLTL